jgi:hypothetical protein
MTDEDYKHLLGDAMRDGLVARGADGHLDLTPEGRRLFGVPDDKSLLQVGLEALLEEVFDEEAEKRARRPTAPGRH